MSTLELLKFSRAYAWGLARPPVSKVEAPLIGGCLAYLQWRGNPEPHNQHRYDLFIGEVAAARAGSRAFRKGRWRFVEDSTRTIHYVADGSYFASGEAFQAQ